MYYPLAVAPYTPALWFARGTADPAFRTTPQIALALVDHALAQDWLFRAVVADGLDGEHHGCTGGLDQRSGPYVVALKPSPSWWAPAEAIGAVWQVAAHGGWERPEQPGDWIRVERTFRDGHEETWWALEGEAGPYGPDRPRRLVIATVDPATLPEAATWYLTTTLPLAAADVAEMVRLSGLRNWGEQADKQVKHSLGWSQYQVRADRARRRHWALVQCAFAFCWWAESQAAPATTPSAEHSPGDEASSPPGRGEKGPLPAPTRGERPWRCWPAARRRLRAWLAPAVFRWRCWTAWSDQPPPPALQALLDWLHHGRPLMLDDSS